MRRNRGVNLWQIVMNGISRAVFVRIVSAANYSPIDRDAVIVWQQMRRARRDAGRRKETQEGEKRKQRPINVVSTCKDKTRIVEICRTWGKIWQLKRSCLRGLIMTTA